MPEFETDEEIWDAVMNLTNKKLLTYADESPNTITDVENTGRPSDRVVIEERNDTDPIKEDIIAAYRFLYQQGEIVRTRDLAWLADKTKQTSSIVFRIIGEIAGDNIQVTIKRPESMKVIR